MKFRKLLKTDRYTGEILIECSLEEFLTCSELKLAVNALCKEVVKEVEEEDLEDRA